MKVFVAVLCCMVMSTPSFTSARLTSSGGLIPEVKGQDTEFIEKFLLTLPKPTPLGAGGEIPDPTLECGLCRDLGDRIFNFLDMNNTSAAKYTHAVEHIHEACADLNSKHGKNSSEERFCDNFGDTLLRLAVEGDFFLLNKVQFNLSIDLCTNLVPVCKVPCCITEDTPEQVHIGFPTGGDAVTTGQMQVTWSTYTNPVKPLVQWWNSNDASNVSSVFGNTTTYTKSGWVGWLHGAVMTDLLPGTTYIYRVTSIGVPPGVNDFVSNFTTLPLNIGTPERPLQVISFADMGTGGTHDQTVAAVETLLSEGKVDMIIHGGDISYADGDQYRWDRFLRQMQSIVSRVPYMLIPGNHELLYNFTAYRTRFFMQPTPGYGAPDDAMYYSFTVGPNIRFMMMDSESVIDTPELTSVQTNWANRLLQEASASKQFVFAAFHRPLYCTSHGGGLPPLNNNCENGPFGYLTYMQGRIEDSFIENNVAIVHTGHVHNYERTYPVAHGVRQSTSYENTTAPVSFVNGAPGCEEGFTSFGQWPERPNWSAKRIIETSFMRTQIYSELQGGTKHTALVNQHSSKDLSVIDNITLTKFL